MNESHRHDLLLLLAKRCIKMLQNPLALELPPLLPGTAEPLQNEELEGEGCVQCHVYGCWHRCFKTGHLQPEAVECNPRQHLSLEQTGARRGEPPWWPQVGFFRWV